jgi:hypothetical protein
MKRELEIEKELEDVSFLLFSCVCMYVYICMYVCMYVKTVFYTFLNECCYAIGHVCMYAYMIRYCSCDYAVN